MAAKKSRDWRSGKREGRSRMVQMTRHLVVTEGRRLSLATSRACAPRWAQQTSGRLP